MSSANGDVRRNVDDIYTMLLIQLTCLCCQNQNDIKLENVGNLILQPEVFVYIKIKTTINMLISGFVMGCISLFLRYLHPLHNHSLCDILTWVELFSLHFIPCSHAKLIIIMKYTSNLMFSTTCKHIQGCYESILYGIRLHVHSYIILVAIYK